MFKRLLATLLIVLTLVPVAGAADNRDELKETLRTLLRDNPDLVLEVLREHSETVLEIAQQGANQRRRKALVAQWKTDLEDPKKVNLADRPVRGEANAPVTVVAYSDFTCPYCQQAAGTVEMLLANYKGKVRYIFKQMPLETHENASFPTRRSSDLLLRGRLASGPCQGVEAVRGRLRRPRPSCDRG